jgi:hypothetical protein
MTVAGALCNVFVVFVISRIDLALLIGTVISNTPLSIVRTLNIQRSIWHLIHWCWGSFVCDYSPVCALLGVRFPLPHHLRLWRRLRVRGWNTIRRQGVITT